jgi:hypothetical protein
MRITRVLLALPVALLFGQIAATAHAQTLGLNFSNPPQVSNNGEAPLEWYTDRSAPCTFSAANGVLTEGVCPSDFNASTPNFFNTQGNKFDLVPGTTTVSIEVYIPETWEELPERLAGFWATAVDSSYAVGNDYPIIEFQGPTTTEVPGPSYWPNNGVAGFYGWNNTASNGCTPTGLGGWNYIGLPANFRYNSWVKLTMTLGGGVLTYTVANPSGAHAVSITSPLCDATEAYLGNVILEGYNYDAPQSIAWKLLKFSFDSNGQIVWN